MLLKIGEAVTNDFDTLPIYSDIITCNVDSNGNIVANYGEEDFAFDGSNGNVMTSFPEFYIYKRNVEGEEYEYIKISNDPLPGYRKISPTLIDRYDSGLGDNVLTSKSGEIPCVEKSIVVDRTLAKARGTGYGLLDINFYDALCCLYLVEYATYNSQAALGNGITNMRYNNSDVALIAEVNTNRFIVNTTGGNAFIVGQTISIGTSSIGNFGVATGRKIIEINDYNESDITGKEIIFDGNPVDIALTNVIWSSGQHSGGCDTLGMKSGCLANDSKHAVIYRGVENIFGNVWQWVDGVNIRDNQAWVCNNPEEYRSNKFEAPYEQLGYINANKNGYSTKLGFDSNHPEVNFPIELGGSVNTYMCDEYYQLTGDKVACVGSCLNNGNNAGLWSWHLHLDSGGMFGTRGARCIKYQ